jgi:ribosomal protein L40E
MAEKKIEGLLQLVSCPKCGGSNPSDARHCSVCGTSLVGKEPAKPAPSAQGAKKKGILGRLFGKPK